MPDSAATIPAPIKAGSIDIKQFTIIKAQKEFDIIEMLVELHIFEDMFSNALTGYAEISDGNNLITALPITGGEVLTIKLEVPGLVNQQFHRSFYIYGVKNRTPASRDRRQTYTLQFISLEGAADNVTFLSKKLKGKTDELATQIFDEYVSLPRVWNKEYIAPYGLSLKDQNLSPEWRDKLPKDTFSKLNTGQAIQSSGEMKVTWVVPMWSPFKAINWLAHRHIDEENYSSTTLFWESSQGFYFGNVDKIIKAQKERKNRKMYFYGLDDAAIKEITDSNNSKNSLLEAYTKVISLDLPKNVDVFDNQDKGYYSSNLHTLDIIRKEYKEYVYDHIGNFPSYNHLSGEKDKASPVFPAQQIRSFYSYKTFRSIHKEMFNDGEDPQYKDWVLQRTSALQELSNIRVEITVPGLCNTEAGEVVEFYYPSMKPKSQNAKVEDLLDPFLQGTFLVTAIRHIIRPDKYEMRLELLKDSYKVSLG